MAQNAANDSPSPGGEGRGEGGRITDFVVVPAARQNDDENLPDSIFSRFCIGK
jgi:hypothetical protein